MSLSPDRHVRIDAPVPFLLTLSPLCVEGLETVDTHMGKWWTTRSYSVSRKISHVLPSSLTMAVTAYYTHAENLINYCPNSRDLEMFLYWCHNIFSTTMPSDNIVVLSHHLGDVTFLQDDSWVLAPIVYRYRLKPSSNSHNTKFIQERF